MPYITTNGINTYYEIAGTGPPVIFIHGGYGGVNSTLVPSSNFWIPDLSDNFTIITYDRRSSGKSTYPNSTYTFNDIVNDLDALIEVLAIDKPFLIGSSAGGPIAMQYAITKPNKLSGLILPNTSARLWNHPDRIHSRELLLERMQHLDEYGESLTYELIERQQAGPNPLTLSSKGPGPQTSQIKTQNLARARLITEQLQTLPTESHKLFVLGELRNQGAFLSIDLTDNLKQIDLPTLILHGDSDTQVPFTLGQELSYAIPDSSFVTIHGAGHGLMSWPTTISHINSFLLAQSNL